MLPNRNNTPGHSPKPRNIDHAYNQLTTYLKNLHHGVEIIKGIEQMYSVYVQDLLNPAKMHKEVKRYKIVLGSSSTQTIQYQWVTTYLFANLETFLDIKQKKVALLIGDYNDYIEIGIITDAIIKSIHTTAEYDNIKEKDYILHAEQNLFDILSSSRIKNEVCLQEGYINIFGHQHNIEIAQYNQICMLNILAHSIIQAHMQMPLMKTELLKRFHTSIVVHYIYSLWSIFHTQNMDKIEGMAYVLFEYEHEDVYTINTTATTLMGLFQELIDTRSQADQATILFQDVPSFSDTKEALTEINHFVYEMIYSIYYPDAIYTEYRDRGAQGFTQFASILIKHLHISSTDQTFPSMSGEYKLRTLFTFYYMSYMFDHILPKSDPLTRLHPST